MLSLTGAALAQKGPETPLRATEMLSNGADVPLASKEGAAEEGPSRGAGGGGGQDGLQAQSRDPLQAALERPCWSRDTPAAQGRACAGIGRLGRREEQPEGAGRDQPQPIFTPMPLGVTGEREERFNFFTFFRTIQIYFN